MSTNEDLDKIEARAALATAGPWWIGNSADPTRRVNLFRYPDATDGIADEVRHLDAEFIANARQDVPWLIGVARKQQNAIDVVLALLEVSDTGWINGHSLKAAIESALR